MVAFLSNAESILNKCFSLSICEYNIFRIHLKQHSQLQGWLTLQIFAVSAVSTTTTTTDQTLNIKFESTLAEYTSPRIFALHIYLTLDFSSKFPPLQMRTMLKTKHYLHECVSLERLM